MFFAEHNGRSQATIAIVMIQPQSLIKGRYRVGRRLGEGGMAIVYLGHDLELGRDVAIKTLRPQFAADSLFRERFAREARAAAILSHPNIIDVFDVGDDGGTPYLVMELVRGHALKEIIASEAPFHPDDVAELIAQIGAALDYAHHKGYVHRDIKPANILIDEHGRARVVDFGIAKGLADTDLTEAGGGFGSVGYIAPEQAEGLMATPASDVYAAGVVAFEMLAGQLPFASETTVGLAMKHVNDPAPPPSSLVSTITPSVDAVVLRALEKDPTRRWSSVGAFARALKSWRSSTEMPPPSTEQFEASQTSKSSLMPTLVTAIIVLGALAGLLWFGLREAPQPVERQPPEVVAPIEPIITGALEDENRDDGEVGPIVDVDEQPTFETAPAPAIDDPAPTIAPAGQAVIVTPNLQGLTIAGSSSALLPLGLRVAQAQPTFSTTVPLNAVVSQDPSAGTPVSPGTIVRVSLSRGPSPFINDNEP